MSYLLVGNGVNIQHGGYAFSNNAIVLRTLQNFTNGNFPEHILSNEPILSKLHLGNLFLMVPDVLKGEYDGVANCSAERLSLSEFKERYSGRNSLRITDVGFEDYYLLHDLMCHKLNISNPDMYYVRESMIGSFLHSIFDNGAVNTLSGKYTSEFIEWLNTFETIFTTNYDYNIDSVVDIPVMHLHGDFVTRKDIYDPLSFRNQLSDSPIKDCVIDDNYPHLYSTALSTHAGAYKEMHLKQKQQANSAVEKFAKSYTENDTVKKDIDSWKNDTNSLVANLYESIMLKVSNPDLAFKQQYPIDDFSNISGKLVILGLSPYNDKHIFDAINNSDAEECIFYFYDEAECNVVRRLLSQKNVSCEPVKLFWNATPKKCHNKTNRKGRFKKISRKDFANYSNKARTMTSSIMPDNDIIKEYNKVTISELNEIISKLKNIKGISKLDNSQNVLLSKIDIHILAEEYNLDPATIYFIGINQAKHDLILLI